MLIINRSLAFLSKRRTGDILAISVVLLFIILSLIRLYPFENELSLVIHTGDDWTAYANYALDIRHNGLLMPKTVPGLYNAPAGFLYPYFIALCFLIFGENTAPVYIIQSFMLGLSVAFVYWAFRDKMKNITGIIFLGSLALFAWLDVYKYYAFRFLSENLALFSTSLFLLCFIKGLEKDSLALRLISAFSVGILILSRPPAVLFGFMLVFIIMPYYFIKKKIGWAHLLLFMSVLILSTSLLGIRNYLICHKLVFLPTQGMNMSIYRYVVQPIPDSVDLSRVNTNLLFTKMHVNSDIVAYVEYMFQKPTLFLDYYFKKILFCLGFVWIKVPQYRWRPHWTLMWVGYFTYLFLCIKKKKRAQLWEIPVHIYIFSNYFTLIVLGQVENYGFRMLIPGINSVLVFSFLAWDMLSQNRPLGTGGAGKITKNKFN